MKNSNKKYKILIVEDNETIRQGVARVIKKMGHEPAAFPDAESVLNETRHADFDILISDYKLPGMNGLELMQHLKQQNPDIEVLMITAFGTIELAVEAMQKGASEFIAKPFSPEELSLKINKLVQRVREKAELTRLSEENDYLREQVEVEFNYGEIIGSSAVMQQVYQTIEKVARGDSSVIIYGESGTGKELVARAIHKASARKDKPFIRVNCGALAEGVLESELFGHERGAFTGALKRKKGRFELANNGNIFLDEIGDIPLATQVKMLRVLQEKEFERVGGEETITVDIRVIAATNKNLKEEIRKGNFREDLFYRLHVIPIYLPSLCERKEDIPLLTEHFIKKLSHDLKIPNLKITEKAQQQLVVYNWPGNIREFENAIERAAVLCENNLIEAADLPFLTNTKTDLMQLPDEISDLNHALETVEKQLLERAMGKTHGVKTKAARMLGIKTSALYYKLEKYDLI